MTAESTQAWYVYAVLPGDAFAPPGDGVLPGAPVEATRFDTLIILASLVPRALFDSANPANRTADPLWMAARVEAHHGVIVAATEAGPCLPLVFGSLFSSLDLVRQWLAPRRGTLLEALARVAGHQEWAVSMQEDSAVHGGWLEAHDPALQAMAAAVAAAGEGTAFLLARRLDKARTAARAAHIAAAATALARRLTDAGLDFTADATSSGLPGWSVLVRDPASGQPASISPPAVLADAVDPGMQPAGLSLRLSGPWPAYAFARAALVQESVDG
jgi:hypothetical protein